MTMEYKVDILLRLMDSFKWCMKDVVSRFQKILGKFRKILRIILYEIDTNWFICAQFVRGYYIVIYCKSNRF